MKKSKYKKPKHIWILLDRDNAPIWGIAWWFTTREAAREVNRKEYRGTLYGPVKYRFR